MRWCQWSQELCSPWPSTAMRLSAWQFVLQSKAFVFNYLPHLTKTNKFFNCFYSHLATRLTRLPIGANANFQRPHRAPQSVSVFQAHFRGFSFALAYWETFNVAASPVASFCFCHNKTGLSFRTTKDLKSQEFCNLVVPGIAFFSLDRNQFDLFSSWILRCPFGSRPKANTEKAHFFHINVKKYILGKKKD